MSDYVTTIGSTSPITITISDDDGPVDLSSATELVLRLRRLADGSTLEVDLLDSVLDAPGGVIEHVWSGEVEKPGMYAAQITVTTPAGVRLVPAERVRGRTWYRFEFLPAL